MKGIFKLIGIIFLIALYCLYGMACLRLTKKPINIYTVGGFIVFGALAGLASFVFFGAIISTEYGLHGEGYKVAILFTLSGIVSTIVSVYSAQFIGRYKK